MNRSTAVKTLSDFINFNTYSGHPGSDRETLHDCLSYLENIAIRQEEKEAGF